MERVHECGVTRKRNKFSISTDQAYVHVRKIHAREREKGEREGVKKKREKEKKKQKIVMEEIHIQLCDPF